MKKLLSAMVVLTLVLVLSACSRPPWEWTGCYYDESACAELSHDTMVQIVDALNAQDAAALKEVFTQNARNEYPGEIDDGVAYLLSLFPDGDVVWQDPEEDPMVGPKWNKYGAHAVWVSSSYRLTSGGKDYELFFEGWSENEIDQSDAGVTGMGAVPWHDPRGDANLNAALRSWYRTLDANERPTVFRMDDGPSSPNVAGQIVDALNAQDGAALRDMFVDGAVANVSTGIDNGLAYLLSQFPNGDLVIVQEDPSVAIISQPFYRDTRTVLLSSFYRVSSGGVDYRLYFAEITENVVDPDAVGIYTLGVVPVAESVSNTPEALMYEWLSWDIQGGALPGIYIPEDEAG